MDAEPLLPANLRIFALGTLGAMLLWVVWLVRSRRLNLRESLVWLLLTATALAMVVFPRSLLWVARLIGAEVPANALFALGFVYVLLNLLSGTIASSGNAERIRRLTQECALLRGEVEELRRKVEGRATARGPGGAA